MARRFVQLRGGGVVSCEWKRVARMVASTRDEVRRKWNDAARAKLRLDRAALETRLQRQRPSGLLTAAHCDGGHRKREPLFHHDPQRKAARLRYIRKWLGDTDAAAVLEYHGTTTQWRVELWRVDREFVIHCAPYAAPR